MKDLTGSQVTSTNQLISPLVSQRYDQVLNPQLDNKQNFEIQPAQNQPPPQNENSIIMQLKDGDEIFDITSKEVKQFKQLKKELKQEEEIIRNRQKLSGGIKATMRQRSIGHLPKNVRPKSASVLREMIEKRENNNQEEFEKRLMYQFFQKLRREGKGRIIKPKDRKLKILSQTVFPLQENQKIIEMMSIQNKQQQVSNDNFTNIANRNSSNLTKINTNNTYNGASSQYNQNGLTYTVFKRLSQNHHNQSLFQQPSSQYQHNYQLQSDSSNIDDKGQENINLKNIIHINSLYSLLSQGGQLLEGGGRPMSAAVPILQVSNEHNYRNNGMKPMLQTQNQTVKKDASIQNDRDQSSTRHTNPDIIPSHISPRKVPDQVKPEDNKSFYITKPKPLWIVSTSKTQRAKTYQNHRGNQVYDYLEMQAKKMQDILSQRNDAAYKSPNNYQHLGQNVGAQFDKQLLINPLKVQSFDLGLNEIALERKSSQQFRPKFSNSQIKKYFQGSVDNYHSRKQQQEASDGKQEMKYQSSKRKYHHKSICIDGNSYYDTPMFGRDQIDLLMQEDNQDKEMQIPQLGVNKLSTLEALNNEEQEQQQNIEKTSQHPTPTAMQQNKKNVLLSKKSSSQNQPTPQQQPNSMGPSTHPLSPNLNEQPSMASGIAVYNSQNPQLLSEEEIVLLEHIREETGESFDSGMAESSHTMQSHFRHATSNPLKFNFNDSNYNQMTQLVPKTAKSFNKTSQIIIDDQGDLDHYSIHNMQNENISLTERQMPNKSLHNFNNQMDKTKSQVSESLKSVIKDASSIIIQKSNSINDNKYDIINNQSSLVSRKTSRVIYNKDQLLRKKSSSSFRAKNYQQSIIDFTNQNILSENLLQSQEELPSTRNHNQINQKNNTSKTPTTRVISKIGGNTVGGVANNNNNNTTAFEGMNYSNTLHQMIVAGESQSSFNDIQNQTSNLQQDREGFLETPRYIFNNKIKVGTHVEINGLKVLQSGELIANFNENSFMISHHRKDSSFDAAGLSSNISGAFMNQNSREYSNHYGSRGANGQDSLLRYNLNNSSLGDQHVKSNKYHRNDDLINFSLSLTKKRKLNQGGVNLANMMEIIPDIRLDEKEVIQDEPNPQIAQIQVLPPRTAESKSYLPHQRQYKQSQDKRYSQMLKRNISVFRRQKKNRLQSVDGGTQRKHIEVFAPISNINQYNSSSTVNDQNKTTSEIKGNQSQLDISDPKQDACISPMHIRSQHSNQRLNVIEDFQGKIEGQNVNSIKSKNNSKASSVKNSPIQNSQQIQGISLQEYFKKQGQTSKEKLEIEIQQKQNENKVDNQQNVNQSLKYDVHSSYQDFLSGTDLKDMQNKIQKHRNTYILGELVTSTDNNISHLTQMRFSAIGNQPQGGLTSHSSARRSTNIFQKNKLIGINNNLIPIVGNLAMNRGHIRSSSSRYQRDKGMRTSKAIEKQSQTNLSHTTQSQTNYLRNSSALSNDGNKSFGLHLNGNSIKPWTRPQSKASIRGGIITPANNNGNKANIQ